MVSKPKVVCPVCENTEYMLADGAYYCSMCRTQSQEMGAETVMDDTMLHELGMTTVGNDTVRTGRRKVVGRRAPDRLAIGVRWSTAEGLTWVLSAWSHQLLPLGVDARAALAQLWTLYLRELRMGFEADGEFAPDPWNMLYRERWNVMGGPPLLFNRTKLERARQKRKRPDLEPGMEEALEAGDESRAAKKLRRKKRRQFFASQTTHSDADTTSASDSEAAPSESGFSDDGYLTDASDLSMLEERSRHKGWVEGMTWSSFCLQCSWPGPAEFLPCKLTVTNLVGLLALAVVGRAGSAITLSDLARLLNSDRLAWHSLPALLPASYQLARQDVSFLTRRPRRLVWTEAGLGRLAHRLGSFLLRHRPGPPLWLPVLLPSGQGTELGRLLARLLADLCLPAQLGPDILAVFGPSVLTRLQSSLLPYLPGDRPKVVHWFAPKPRAWGRHRLANPVLRTLGLVIIYLKYLCGLDDQTEVIWRHNLSLLARHSPPAPAAFCLVSWLRLSKARLDQLATLCPSLRHQYRAALSPFAPPLTFPTRLAAMRDSDLTTTKYAATTNGGVAVMMPTSYISRSALAPVSSLLEPLAVGVQMPGRLPASLTPLAGATELLMQTDGLPGRVARAVDRLQAMTDSSMAVYTGLEVPREVAAAGLEVEEHAIHNTWVASIGKFADLRGRSEEDVAAWRRAKDNRYGYNTSRMAPWMKRMYQERVAGDVSFNQQNQYKLVEISDQRPLTAAQQAQVALEGRAAYLQWLHRAHWATARSHHPAQRPQGEAWWHLARRHYWLSHPADSHVGEFDSKAVAARATWEQPACAKIPANKLSPSKRRGQHEAARDPGLTDRLLGSLPANYAWLLRYLAAWGSLHPLDLHMEVANIERLLLALDPQYFGCPKLLRHQDPNGERKQASRLQRREQEEDKKKESEEGEEEMEVDKE